jgi:hypothetical protein
MGWKGTKNVLADTLCNLDEFGDDLATMPSGTPEVFSRPVLSRPSTARNQPAAARASDPDVTTSQSILKIPLSGGGGGGGGISGDSEARAANSAPQHVSFVEPNLAAADTSFV